MLVCLNSYTGILPPHRPQGHGQLQGANHIDLRYSADALKAVSDLQLSSLPQVILKIHPPSSLDYRARHGPQTIFLFISLYNKQGEC